MGTMLAWVIATVAMALPRGGAAREPRGRGWLRMKEEWWWAWERQRGFVVGFFVGGWHLGLLVLVELRT